MAETAAAAPVCRPPPLPEDVICEILVRIKYVPTLFRCAHTCKQWARLVSDASFLRRRWPPETAAHTASFLAGFFPWGRLGVFNPAASYAKSFFPGLPRLSVFGPVRRALKSFFSANDEVVGGGLLDSAVPLLERHGLLLVQLASAPRLVGYPPDGIVRLAVCNLLTDACDVLPPLKCGWAWSSNYSGHAILTGADCFSVRDKRQPLPPPPPEGYSFFFKVRPPTGHLDSARRCNDSGDGVVAEWLRTSVIELKLSKQVWIEGRHVLLILLGEKCGTLIVKDNHRHVYAADLETGTMEELIDYGEISYLSKLEPFGMDWPTSFTSRLAFGCQQMGWVHRVI
ncbi:hypothetical protein BRADI_1g30891v3 [Brachypodium distachyon]|uniref:F-box domain-containing protein n=1 Tax=Brachypodium distachyon TaxID=15368 RepID=A0A0Q3H1K9_BRADI|nr:hypothetical protein BRADI_1g30891v3 [Brachypodium distachyon]